MSIKRWWAGGLLLAAVTFGVAGCDPEGQRAGDFFLRCRIGDRRVEVRGGENVGANYTESANVTTVQTGEQGPYRFILAFPGHGTGSWTHADRLATLIVVDRSTSVMYVASADFARGGANLAMSITSYGRVGGGIEGTFSGEVVAQDRSTLTIANGSFRARRLPDM